ncbi:MAG TPA: hypothetical protein DEP53_02035, partial [Bacteroidetes bacterium]|nr:hypothetical protein [Bacteroidota bacterium]
MASYNFKKKVLPLLTKIGIGLGIGVAVALLRIWDPGFIQNVDHLTTDYRSQRRFEHDTASSDWWNPRRQADVVIVGIADEDMKTLPRPFPYPRSYYAHLVENLERCGVRAIAFDLTLDAPADSAADAEFDAVLSKYNNIILATKSPEESGAGRYVLSTLERSYPNVFYKPGRYIGIVSTAGKDRDDVARRYYPMMTIGNFLTPTFSFATLNVALKLLDTAVADIDYDGKTITLGDRSIPSIGDGRSFLISYYGPNNTFRYIKFTEVIDDSSFKTKEELEIGENIDQFDLDEELREYLKGKIVVVGSTMAEERDIHQVPITNIDGTNTMNGVEIHATAIQNVLRGDYVQRANPNLELALIIFLGIISFFAILQVRLLKVRYVVLLEFASVAIVGLLVFAVFEIAVRSFINNSTLINIVYPGLAVVFAYLGAAVYQYLAERQQKALIKNVFSKYISAAVVNELVANPEKAKLGGDRRELT